RRGPPVVPPVFADLVVLERWLGWRAAGPLEQELVRAPSAIGAVIADTEWNVTHQGHAALLRVRFHVAPLLVCYPLHVTEEIQTSADGCLLLLRHITQPIASTFDRVMLRRPLVPRGTAVILLDKNAEQSVVA